MSKPFIVCLMGPTASGKTQLAIDLVKRFPFEIISVDSAMVYRGMNIGTAKPSTDILKIAPHRLLDIRDPAEAYSAAQFREDALHEINNIIARGNIPLLVGGTMLYFSALQKGLSELPSADPTVRATLLAQGIEQGWPALHERLAQVDPVAAARIHPNDAQRIQRALEVYEITAKSLTAWQQESSQALSAYQVINIAVSPADRSVLHGRIANRFTEMLAQGFLQEVRQLFARGDLTLETPAIRAVGYRQAWEYLLGYTPYEEIEAKVLAATRQLAKRQLTWLRHWPLPIAWFESTSLDLLSRVTHYLREEKVLS